MKATSRRPIWAIILPLFAVRTRWHSTRLSLPPRRRGRPTDLEYFLYQKARWEQHERLKTVPSAPPENLLKLMREAKAETENLPPLPKSRYRGPCH